MKRQVKRRRSGRAKQKKLFQRAAKLDVRINANPEALQNLISHLQQVSESEKSKLAHELHDQLGAILTASRMDIAWVRQHLTSEQSSLAGKLSRALGHLDQGIYLKRRVIENLRPTTLTTIGFMVAAQDLAQQMGAQSGWHLEFQFPEKDPDLPQDMAISLFRILQESLTNIVKHACASVVRVCMEYDSGVVKLEVEDNGIGFRNHSDEVNAKMPGLLSMRQQAIAYGGLFEIKSQLEQGTLVRVLIYPEKHNRNAPSKPM